MRKITIALALVFIVFLVVMIGQKSKERSSKEQLEVKQASQVIKTNTAPKWLLFDPHRTETKPTALTKSGFPPKKPIPPPVLTDEQMNALPIPPLPAWAEEVPPPPSLTNEEIVDLVEYLKKEGLLNEDGSINKKASEKLFMADLSAPKQTFTSEELGFAPIKKPTSKKANIPSPPPGFILEQPTIQKPKTTTQAPASLTDAQMEALVLKIMQSLTTPVIKQESEDWLEQRHEAQRILDDLKSDLRREQSRIEDELQTQGLMLQFQMENMIEEQNNRIAIERLFPDIYRPVSSYRNPWIYGTQPYYDYLRMYLRLHPNGNE